MKCLFCWLSKNCWLFKNLFYEICKVFFLVKRSVCLFALATQGICAIKARIFAVDSRFLLNASSDVQNQRLPYAVHTMNVSMLLLALDDWEQLTLSSVRFKSFERPVQWTESLCLEDSRICPFERDVFWLLFTTVLTAVTRKS